MRSFLCTIDNLHYVTEMITKLNHRVITRVSPLLHLFPLTQTMSIQMIRILICGYVDGYIYNAVLFYAHKQRTLVKVCLVESRRIKKTHQPNSKRKKKKKQNGSCWTWPLEYNNLNCDATVCMWLIQFVNTWIVSVCEQNIINWVLYFIPFFFLF